MGEHGQGTGPFPITNRQGKVRFRVAVTMADGTRVWRTRPTQRLAELARQELVEQRELELELDPGRQTLEAFLRSWVSSLATARNSRVKPRTLDHYRLVVERHIAGTPLGRLKLGSVTESRVQAWIDADASAPQTVRHHHAVLRRALNVAVRQRKLTRNPALGVELPRVSSDVARPLSADEARRLVEATADDRLGVLWQLALVTGLRQGELLGLAWDDVDGDVLTVRAQLQRLTKERGGDDRGWARTTPKAARRVSRIALDPDTAAELDAHRRRMAAERRPGWPYHGLVFVTSRGLPYHQSEVRKAFTRALERAGLPPRRFHDLRHTNLTLLRDLGVAEDTRMARAGHASTRMARRYAAASETQDRAAAVVVGRAIRA